VSFLGSLFLSFFYFFSFTVCIFFQRCWSSDSYNPVPGITPNVPSSRGYTGGFGCALIEKDLMLAMEAANSIKARLPLGAEAHQLYGLLCEQGYGDKDFSVVFEFLNKSMKK
jgi:3-hydroxyisobutyrate dehydrogenase